MKQFITLIIVVLFTTTGYSQVSSNSDLKHTTPVRKELGKVDGYLEHLPPGYSTNTKKYPLIVYLHGTGERGNGSSDLYKIARVGDPSRRAEENGSLCFTVNGEEQCFIVISPQLNMGENWTASNQERFWQYILGEAGYRIDKDRVYLTGHSLGGNGVWEAAYSDYNAPNMFAAIAPLSYWTNISRVCKVADRKIPVWAFCGQLDYNFIVQSQAAISTLRICPGRDPSVEIKFTEVSGAGHGITGPTYRVDHSMYNPNLYEWLLSKKNGGGSSKPTAPDTPGQLQANAQSSSSVKITWTDNASNENGFRIKRSESPGEGFTTAGTVSANVTSFTDNGLDHSTKYYYKLQAYNNSGNSAYTDQVSATTFTSSSGGDESATEGSAIDWVNIHGAVQKGNDLESTASSGWGNSGAGSGQSIASNSDGWIEMVIEDPSRADLVFGLSDDNVNDNIASTDYGFELSKYNNSYWTRETSDRTYLGKYSKGDKLRIERSGSKIVYKKNGQTVATTNVSSRPALVADVTLLNNESTVFNGRISSSSLESSGSGYINWVNIHGAVQKGNDLESTASSGWGNSGAGSGQSIASNSDGWIEMVIEDPSRADLVFGLSDDNVNDNIASTDYGFELSKYNNSYWTRETSDRTYLGTYSKGDKLRIERSGNKIVYKKNGQTVATTNVSSRPSLVADVTLLNNGSTVFQGRISSSSLEVSNESPGDGYINWVNIHGAVQKGNDLESTASSGWGNSGAGSGQSIASNSDGWIEMVIEDPSRADLVFGLSDVNVNDNIASTDYGFELSKYNNSYWTRETSDRTYLGTYSKGDKLRIERSGYKIFYKKNGQTVATTNVSSRPSLVADVTLLNNGSTVFNGSIYSASSGSRTADQSTEEQTEISNEQEFLVYPNPIGEEGRLTIGMEGYDPENETRFLLYDLNGKLVVDQALDSPSTEIVLQNLRPSLYTYRLIQDGHQIKSGLIKK